MVPGIDKEKQTCAQHICYQNPEVSGFSPADGLPELICGSAAAAVTSSENALTSRVTTRAAESTPVRPRTSPRGVVDSKGAIHTFAQA